MNEIIDWESPSSITTKEDLAVEVSRLSARLARPAPATTASTRRRLQLDQWLVRHLESAPEDPNSAEDDGFLPVAVPYTVVSPYTHFRHYFDVTGKLGAAPLLRFDAVDYECTVLLDGVVVGDHRGYFAPFDIPLAGAGDGPHCLDVVVRRAVDYVTWDGTDSAQNFGDAHGKGLGSVAEGIPTAGCGLLGSAWLEETPGVRIVDVYAALDGADVVVEVELSGLNSAVAGHYQMEATLTEAGSAASAGHAQVAFRGQAGESSIRVAVPVGSGPRRWTPTEPALYDLAVVVTEDDRTVDAFTCRTGFRDIIRTADGSLLLNGEPLYLRGTTTVGDMWEAAWGGDRETLIERMLQVKALNANVLRVHVSVLSPLAYECADEVGLLLYQDAPLQWHCFEPVKEQLEREVDQVAELVHLVRRHPSVIVLSFPNEMHMWEPFHPSDVQFVEQAAARVLSIPNSLVMVQDHSGGTRPQVMPQSFHEYPGYFDGTSDNAASIISTEGEGIRAIISEFGAGAVPSWKAFQRTAEAHRDDAMPFPLPASPDLPWPAELGRAHVIGGTMDLLQRSTGRRGSFEKYHEASQRHQARVLRRQAGRIRRDRANTSGVIQHYFRQPTDRLYNSWFDLAIIDGDGTPTAGFQALREAYRVVGLEITGLPERVFSAADVEGTLWIYNDLGCDVEAVVRWRCTGADGNLAIEGEFRMPAPAASSDSPGRLVVPGAALTTGDYELTAELEVDGRAWTTASERFSVRAEVEPLETSVAVLGDLGGVVERVGHWLPDLREYTPGIDVSAVLVTPGADLSKHREQLLEFVGTGGRLVLLERPPGEDLSWLSSSAAALVAGDHAAELANVEYSLVDSGLSTDDLSHWQTPDGRVVTYPILAADTRLSPQWASAGIRLQYSVVQEFKNRYGSTVVCQAHVWDCAATDPSAAQLWRHTIAKPARVIA